MKPGFYISMGIAITALAVGFILLNDVQQTQEKNSVWIQKIPKQCNDVWNKEYTEFYEINPDLIDVPKEEKNEILEKIIKTHYENQGLTVLNLELEPNYFEGVRCAACDCLGWDRLLIEIPEDQLTMVPENEGWQPTEG